MISGGARGSNLPAGAPNVLAPVMVKKQRVLSQTQGRTLCGTLLLTYHVLKPWHVFVQDLAVAFQPIVLTMSFTPLRCVAAFTVLLL